MSASVIALVCVVGLALGLLVLGYSLHRRRIATVYRRAQQESKSILENARKESDRLVQGALSDAKEEYRKRRREFEQEAKQRRQEVAKLEDKLKQREVNLRKKQERLENKEQSMQEQIQSMEEEESHYRKLAAKAEQQLETVNSKLKQVANMSIDEARKELMQSMEEDVRKQAKDKLRQIEEETRREADNQARAIISASIQRISSEFVNDAAVTVVSIPSESMKGRIIGREGRNIRAIEQLAGVDIIIDDTPEAVIISCFNPVRREIAKIMMERLIADGRIHPARIGETIETVKGEIEQSIIKDGEQALFQLGIGDFHPELVSRLGRLKYCMVGQQTVLQHSLETAQIARIMAAEMGSNVREAARSGLLHDIGKAVDESVEGHHAEVGAEICKKYGESARIVEAVKLHHSDQAVSSDPLYSIIYTANQLSANRPGARKTHIEAYIKRLKDMERIVSDCDGVSSAYVLKAGSEVRALVTPTVVSDSEVIELASEISAKLRGELTFPGQVKINIIKESKSIYYAT